jgi:excinuclease ABC subunit A
MLRSLLSSSSLQAQPRAWRLMALDFHTATALAQLPTRGVCELATAASYLDCAPLLEIAISNLAERLGSCNLPHEIRALFAQLPEARARGYTASRFSFNTEGGRCEPCKGNGSIKLEMNFLPTTYIVCEECGGRRYAASTLEVQYNGKSIGDIMDLTIAEAAEFFAGVPKIARTLNLMSETGLGYLHLGQPSPSLSGGEAQRIKLVTELTKGIGRATNARLRQNRTPKSNLDLIEEPSIGLHLSDVKRLLEIIHHLVDDGHTVVVIEHHLDLLAEADYIIELGPVGGPDGGELLFQGELADLLKIKRSPTAPYLRAKLKS